jgi:hypothetical protein
VQNFWNDPRIQSIVGLHSPDRSVESHWRQCPPLTRTGYLLNTQHNSGGHWLRFAAGSEEKMNYVVVFANNSKSMVNIHYLKTNFIPARQEIPAFYGNRIFITVFTTTRHLSLTAFRWSPSTSSHSIPLRHILILSSHLHDFFSEWPLSFIFLFYSSHAESVLFFFSWSHEWHWWGVQQVYQMWRAGEISVENRSK